MASLPKGQRHPAELRERAVRMVLDHQYEYPSQWKAIGSVAEKLDINRASIGSKGDSYDNSLAESFNGLYKWELIHRQGPWHGLDDVEFATMTYVDWSNHRRLHGAITDGPGYTTPARHEADHYRQTNPADKLVTQ